MTTPFDRVESLRAARGLSQRSLCAAAGLNASTLAQAKRSGGQLSLETLQALAPALAVGVAELLGEDPAAPPAPAPGQTPLEASKSATVYRLADIAPSPLNPRKTFDDEALEQLAASIAQQGLLQNLVIRLRPDGQGYWIVAGERRWRALTILAERGQWDPSARTVPAKLVEVDDAGHLALAILENLQRQDIDPLEEAAAFRKLMAIDPDQWNTATIAERIGMTRRHVQLRLRLLGLVPEAQAALRDGRLTLAQARELTAAPPAVQARIAAVAEEFATADDVRYEITCDMVPTERAIFMPEPGEIFEDEGGGSWFVDRNAFMARQKAAAEARAAELAREWKWARFEEGWFYSVARRSDDRALAGAVVVLRHDGTVEEHLGIVSPQDDPAAVERDAQRDATAARNEARLKAATAFRDALAARVAADPATALALLLLDRATDYRHHTPIDGGASGLPASLIDGGPLRKLAGMVNPAHYPQRGGGYQMLKADADTAAAWRILAGLKPGDAQTVLARMMADRLSVSWHQPLSPVLRDLAARYGVPVPACLEEGDEPAEVLDAAPADDLDGDRGADGGPDSGDQDDPTAGLALDRDRPIAHRADLANGVRLAAAVAGALGIDPAAADRAIVGGRVYVDGEQASDPDGLLFATAGITVARDSVTYQEILLSPAAPPPAGDLDLTPPPSLDRRRQAAGAVA